MDPARLDRALTMGAPSALHRIANRVSARSRARKHAYFMATMNPGPGDTILDVGANVIEHSEGDNYLEKHYPHPRNITVVCLDDTSEIQRRYPEITFVKGDGRRLPYPDSSFDIAYSNAVIEHVGNREDQVRFLRELARVAPRGYLTTPNRYFPVETHTRIPLLHILMPKPLFDRFLRAVGQGWAAGDYMNLLSRGDLDGLLRDAGIARYTIQAHRLLGMTLTYTVVWGQPD
jgi:hypothetical protein